MAQISKRDQILKKAGEMFLHDGFSKTSMDAIAEGVPVSKPTLYNHFKDKKELFAAVVTERCNRLLTVMKASATDGREVKAVLSEMGAQFLAMVLSPQSLNMHRIVAAESREFPDMAKLFYESGPKQAHAFLMRYLQKQHEKGALQVKDPALSASMFLSQLKGNLHMQCLLGLRGEVSTREQKRIIDYAVQIFLNGHSAAKSR